MLNWALTMAIGAALAYFVGRMPNTPAPTSAPSTVNVLPAPAPAAQVVEVPKPAPAPAATPDPDVAKLRAQIEDMAAKIELLIKAAEQPPAAEKPTSAKVPPRVIVPVLDDEPNEGDRRILAIGHLLGVEVAVDYGDALNRASGAIRRGVSLEEARETVHEELLARLDDRLDRRFGSELGAISSKGENMTEAACARYGDLLEAIGRGVATVR